MSEPVGGPGVSHGPRAEAVVAGWVAAASKVTVLTGAGISTDSGIPDFRGPDGLWTRNPPPQRLFQLSDYVADPEVRVQAWRNRKNHPAWTAKPSAGHAALVELERAGRLRALITQNIDGLHQAAGSAPDKVLEIHGSLREAVCLGCGRRTPMRAVLARVAAGESDPRCVACGGIQKSATISFGQPLERRVLDAAARAAGDCELFLAVGSTLQVQPAASLCGLAKRQGARLAIVNARETGYDAAADAIVRAPIGEVLPRLVAAAFAT